MVAITATSAALVTEEWSNKVPSPAYDSMTPGERRKTRKQNSWSFLNVTLSPEDVSDDAVVSNEKLISMARESLQKITDVGAFKSESECLYAYRLQRDNHRQTAIVADIDLSDYENGNIKRHEHVKQHRADLLAAHLQCLGVSSSPIALTYRNDPTLTELLNRCTAQPPLLNIDASFGVQQTIWRLPDPSTIANFKAAFSHKRLYIIDGHHRAAATLATNNHHNTTRTRQIFGAMFPHNELKLLGFNRWIKPLPMNKQVNSSTLVDCCGAVFIDEYKSPDKGELVIYIDKHWMSVGLGKYGDTDASALQTLLRDPDFSIDPGDQSALENIPGNQPYHKLCELVDTHGGFGIFLAPLGIDEFLEIADSNEILPPKSTYFTPKIQSGVFLRSIY